jgi:hypothetical protein
MTLRLATHSPGILDSHPPALPAVPWAGEWGANLLPLAYVLWGAHRVQVRQVRLINWRKPGQCTFE